jgi:hypothetical protein
VVTSWLWFSTLALPVVAGALVWHARTGLATPLLPEAAREKDPTLDMIPWTPLEGLLADAGIEPGQSGVVLAAPHWIQGGRVGAALADRWPVIVADENAHHFPFLHDRRDFVGDDVIFVGTREGVESAMERFEDRFDGFEDLGRVDLERGGEVVMTLGAIRGNDLRSPLPPLDR